MSLDVDYENLGFIPGGSDYPQRWAEDGQAYRERAAAIGRARLNQSYGPSERQKLDVFYPGGKPEGLVVFVHGGYWRRFDRSCFSHFSEGLTGAGFAVAMPSYTLASEARIRDMTREIAAAINTAADLIEGPLMLVGHSAGGHLVARMGDPTTPIKAPVRTRVTHIVPVSPVSDLRPLLETEMNQILRLDTEEAATESPVLAPKPDAPITVWAGAEERPVFLDQARLLAEAWQTDLRLAPGRHHLDILDGLQDKEDPLVRSILASRS